MSEAIPVISLWMPWANWVSLQWKPIETRLHKRFASLVGKRIAIHCSLKIGGAIICTAFVKEFRKLTANDSQAALIECGETERYGLILEDVRMIEAIPCKGRQGIWYQEIEGQAR